ncbi:unnamed protein product [Rhizoctonia solani]|nr:unnamed protein product [Rhizoctonia solani]
MTKKQYTTLATPGGYAVSINRASDTGADAEAPNTESLELVRHTEFYFDNTLVTVQVENTLFNVHKYQLVKSEVFSDIFKSMENRQPREGSSSDLPIVMKGITASDFAVLLKILYARHCPCHQPAMETSTALIMPAFRLANALQFSEVCADLLPLAERDLGDVDKIVFAREFDIKDWLATAHVRLCQREEPLSNEEARKLGVDSVLIISHMREKHQGQNYKLSIGNDYCGACLGVNHHVVAYTCHNCHGGGIGHFRYVGPGTIQKQPNPDSTAIMAEVAKWIEDGCVVRK